MAKTMTREEAFDFADPSEKGEAVGAKARGGRRPAAGAEERGPADPSARPGTRRGTERGELVRRTWLIPEDVARSLKVRCAEEGLNASDVVGSLIEGWLAHPGE